MGGFNVIPISPGVALHLWRAGLHERRALRTQAPDSRRASYESARRLPRLRLGSRKHAFFGLADVYLFPSSHESYGLTLMEALSAGLPAISRDHAGARQILKPEFGITVPAQAVRPACVFAGRCRIF